MLATALAILLAAAPAAQAKLPLRPCVVQGVPARCGTLARAREPGHRSRPAHRPARRRRAGPAQARDARTRSPTSRAGRAAPRQATRPPPWRASGAVSASAATSCSSTSGAPGARTSSSVRSPSRSTTSAPMINACLATLNGDPTQYGSAAAADDLEAVRAALGYRRLDVYGGSYGATLAQIYLARHPRSVRTVDARRGDIARRPLLRAVRGERAARARPGGRALRGRPGLLARVPDWPAQLRSLIAAWNERPAGITPD